jgi:hypothetical protein
MEECGLGTTQNIKQTDQILTIPFSVPRVESGLLSVAAAAESGLFIAANADISMKYKPRQEYFNMENQSIKAPNELVEISAKVIDRPATEETPLSEYLCGWAGCNQDCRSLAGLVNHLNTKHLSDLQ